MSVNRPGGPWWWPPTWMRLLVWQWRRAGAVIREERRGYVYVDGRRLDEQYVRPDRRDDRTISPRRVPERSYIGLGDNRSQSCDSREWGPIPRKNVVGKIVVTYWPPNRISFR